MNVVWSSTRSHEVAVHLGFYAFLGSLVSGAGWSLFLSGVLVREGKYHGYFMVSRVQIRVFLREGFSWSCCFGVGGLWFCGLSCAPSLALYMPICFCSILWPHPYVRQMRFQSLLVFCGRSCVRSQICCFFYLAPKFHFVWGLIHACVYALVLLLLIFMLFSTYLFCLCFVGHNLRKLSWHSEVKFFNTNFFKFRTSACGWIHFFSFFFHLCVWV